MYVKTNKFKRLKQAKKTMKKQIDQLKRKILKHQRLAEKFYDAGLFRLGDVVEGALEEERDKLKSLKEQHGN